MMREALERYILTILVLLLLGSAILLLNGMQNMAGKLEHLSQKIDAMKSSTADIKNVLSDCIKLYSDFDELPEEVQLIIANMMFNMGRPRLSKFKGMKRGVDARDWNAAADEMVDSKWYRQVTKRADRLVERMRNV